MQNNEIDINMHEVSQHLVTNRILVKNEHESLKVMSLTANIHILL